MIDWDDVRYFLAVARGGSVRAAAEHLGVNHSTVLRRIAQLEERLGAQMFEKLPSGYRLTAAGEEVLELAHQMALAHAADGWIARHLADRVCALRDQDRGRPGTGCGGRRFAPGMPAADDDEHRPPAEKGQNFTTE